MAKPFKIFLIVVGVIVVLIVGAAAAAIALFDPAHIKAQASKAARDNTGRELTIAGDLDLSLFPWLGVSMSDATLANAEGFGPQPFAHLKDMDVRVKLLPLLTQQRVEIGKVIVSGLSLNLERNEDGVSNWDDLEAEGEAESGTDEAQQGPAPSPDQPPKVMALEVGGLDISDVTISMVDRQAGTTQKLEKLSLQTGPLTLEDPIDLAVEFLASSNKPQVTADVKLSFTGSRDKDTGVVEARGVKLDVTAEGEPVPGGKQQVSLTTDLRYDEKKQLAELTGLVVNAMDAKVSANVRHDLAAGITELKGLVAEAMGARINGNIHFDQKADTLRLSETVAEARGIKVNVTLNGEGITGDSPRLSGKMSSNTFNAREVAKKFEAELPPMADNAALTAVTFASDISSDLKSARLDNLRVKLDNSTATGHLHVTDLESQAVQFALKLDRIDADRYLPPEPKEEAKKGGTEEDFRSTELPLGALDTVNARGRIEIGDLTLKKQKLSNVVVELDAPKGKLKTQTLNAKLYGGTLAQTAKITPGEKPTYTMNATLRQIEAGPLVELFTGKKYLSGLGDLELNIASGGTTVGDALKGLNGNVSSSLVKGAIEGFNMKHKVEQARALYNREQAPAATEKRTQFADLKGAGEIKNGVLTTKSLNASGNDYKLSGDGKIDLAGMTIDYVLSPTYTGAAGMKELAGTSIPLRVSGSLFSPEVKVDIAGALKGKAREAVQEVKETYKEEIKEKREKVKEKAIKRLGDFLSPKKKETTETEEGAAEGN